MRRALPVFLLTLLFALPSKAANFKVIVNSGNPVTSMAPADVAAMLLKKKPKWPNGLPVVPVDLIESSPVREAFSQEVLHKSTIAVKSYWRQQIFGGYDVPPVEKRSDAEVVEFVRANAGAVGYVSEGAPASGVKTIEVR